MIFTSGSCRAMDSQSSLEMEILHDITNGFYGEQSIGYLHNAKQHLQLMRFLYGMIDLPDDIQYKFFTKPYNSHNDHPVSAEYLARLKRKIPECRLFLFEICSLKIYEENGYQLCSMVDTPPTIQTKDELYSDLVSLVTLLPADSHILLQGHFQYPGVSIPNRHTIYQVLSTIEQEFKNVTVINPCAELIRTYIQDDLPNHYTEEGKAFSRELLSRVLTTLN